MNLKRVRVVFVVALLVAIAYGWWALEQARNPHCFHQNQSWSCSLIAGKQLILVNNDFDFLIITASDKGGDLIRQSLAYDGSGEILENKSRSSFHGVKFHDGDEKIEVVFSSAAWQPYR